jgi:hypothetical protein
MPGINDDNSLVNGIPNRTISPETGSWGNATKTNRGDTGEGTNQSHDSRPALAADLEGAALTTDDTGEHRSFRSDSAPVVFPESDVEPVYQQIADGGDHFDHDKHLGDDKAHKADKHRRERDVE